MSKNIYALIIDTSSEKPFLILTEKHLPIAYKELTSKGKNFTFQLLPEIKNLLKEEKCSLKALSYIAVGIGPGSYTGTRTGACVASGLSYGLKLPLISFYSLQSYASKMIGKFHVITSARSRGIYLIEGKKTHADTFFKKKPFFFTHILAKKYLEKMPRIITPHFEEMKKIFTFTTLEKAKVNTLYLSEHCYNKYLKGDFSLDHKVEIAYLQEANIT